MYGGGGVEASVYGAAVNLFIVILTLHMDISRGYWCTLMAVYSIAFI
jgi:hypothetical protein